MICCMIEMVRYNFQKMLVLPVIILLLWIVPLSKLWPLNISRNCPALISRRRINTLVDKL